MKKFFIIASAFIFTIWGSVCHADGYSYNCPSACLPCGCCNFHGFYVGGNVGVLGLTSHVFDADGNFFGFPVTTTGHDTAATLGVQAGHDWQICNVLFGLVVDWNWTHARVTSDVLPNFSGVFSAFNRQDLDWFLTLRARSGFVFDCSLIYLTAGAVVGDIETVKRRNILSGGVLFDERFSFDRKKWGFVGGVGLEHIFCGCLSVNGEILYLHFSRDRRTLTSPTNGIASTFYRDDNAFVIRVGLNYRFSFGFINRFG